MASCRCAPTTTPTRSSCSEGASLSAGGGSASGWGSSSDWSRAPSHWGGPPSTIGAGGGGWGAASADGWGGASGWDGANDWDASSDWGGAAGSEAWVADDSGGQVRVVSSVCCNPACARALYSHFATCTNCETFQDDVWKCGRCGLYTRGPLPRCRFAQTMGCSGTRADGHVPTAAEKSAATEVMRRVRDERAGSAQAPRPVVAAAEASGGKGKGGKGNAQSMAGKGGKGGSVAGKGGGQQRAGGGKGAGKGSGGAGGASGLTRVAVMEAVERGLASGDNERLIQEVRRAALGR